MELKTKKELSLELSEKLLNCKTSKTRRAISEGYKTLFLYLESAPKSEFITNEIIRLKQVIKINDSRFDAWLKDRPKEAENKTNIQTRTIYNAKFGTTKAKQQIKNLQILIN